jgi:hypothetical protein
MALTTAEVTAVSRNSGTRRIREDTQGHDQGANQAQEDTGGAAGIRKDTTLGRFGTVRPKPAMVLTAKMTAKPANLGGRSRRCYR